MGPCRDEFGDSAGEGGGGVDGKDGDLVLSVTNSLFEFYDGEEVGACRAEEMGGGGTGDVLDVDHGDVAYETFLVVDDGDGGDAAGGHGLEGGQDMGVCVDGNDVCGPDPQFSNLMKSVSDGDWGLRGGRRRDYGFLVEGFKVDEGTDVFPEEFDYFALTEDTDDVVVGSFASDSDTMDS